MTNSINSGSNWLLRAGFAFSALLSLAQIHANLVHAQDDCSPGEQALIQEEFAKLQSRFTKIQEQCHGYIPYNSAVTKVAEAVPIGDSSDSIELAVVRFQNQVLGAMCNYPLTLVSTGSCLADRVLIFQASVILDAMQRVLSGLPQSALALTENQILPGIASLKAANAALAAELQRAKQQLSTYSPKPTPAPAP